VRGRTTGATAEDTVSFLTRFKNKSQITRGRAKQKIGRATRNRRLRAEGAADRVSGSAKLFGNDVKDGAKRTFRR
jgi:uncharacterized protein YjbJ (UPF0337 family)